MFATQTVCIVEIGPGSGMIAPSQPIRWRPALLSDQVGFYAEVVRRVRLARECAGLTQDALGARVSLSRTSVTNKGRQKVLLHTFCNLADALGVAPAVLLPDKSSTARAED